MLVGSLGLADAPVAGKIPNSDQAVTSGPCDQLLSIGEEAEARCPCIGTNLKKVDWLQSSDVPEVHAVIIAPRSKKLSIRRKGERGRSWEGIGTFKHTRK